MESDFEPTLGAKPMAGGTRFRVWAPRAERARLVLEAPARSELTMEAEEGGYFRVWVDDVGPGSRYRFAVDGGPPLPDPASRWQPEGVHGPSAVVDPDRFEWSDQAWEGVELPRLTFYELHLGTFTPEGTFAAARRKLPYLRDLGVSAIELMPLADFPGRWNWGYDPAAFFAPSRAYGSPDDLRGLVDEAHRLGLAVFVDAVYNHFGPDGAYLPAFSPYVFTDRHHTPWGQAVNFDGPHSEGVRRYCLENALMWLSEYHADGLRLDATFAIVDDSPKHLLTELAELAERLPGRRRLLVAEDPRNLRNLVLPAPRGYGLDAVWADDFHHQVRSALAGDDQGYYRDFTGSSADLSRTLRGNWFYTGQLSRNSGAARGTPAFDLDPEHFVYCIQNHDQVGNRPEGTRLHADVELGAYRAASALLLFAPQLPLLFMGQEWAASTPFQYFTDHHGELGRAVSEGRKREFADFAFGEDVPDPQDPATFRRSVLDWAETERWPHQGILRLYRDLLAMRKELEGGFEASSPTEGLVWLRRGRRRLIVALQGGVRAGLEPGATITWSSEDAAYAEEPRPPLQSDGELRFPAAAAVVVEVDA